jgi:GDP-L-fucose synthase
MKLLLTGGNGFLGKHIQKELNKHDIQYLSPSSYVLDILYFDALKNYLMCYKPDTILHMSAICGGIVKNSHIPADFLYTNTQMALNIYEAARQCNITNIYSIGSICMYPVNCPTPFKEDDIWNGMAEQTNFPYGQAKRTLMMLGQTYRQQYRFTGAHLIPVNMYGIGDAFDDEKSHVIPALIKKFVGAKENNLPAVECLGSGEATREFLYVSDNAEAIVKAIITKLDTGLPINIGVGKDISIKNLAKLIKELVSYDGEIVWKNDGLDGQPKRLLDVSRAKQLLNWTATTSLKEGLIKTINWYMENRPKH